MVYSKYMEWQQTEIHPKELNIYELNTGQLERT